MSIEQIEARLAEIAAELETADIDRLAVLQQETDGLVQERDRLRAAESARAELRTRVAAGDVGTTPAPIIPTIVPENRKTGIDSPEYRMAWLKHISGQAMNAAERRALVTGITGTTEGEPTDTSGQALYVPTEIQNRIFDLISVNHAIIGDVTTLNSNTVIDIPYVDSMDGASITAEGTAPDETTFTLGKLTLAGKEFTAWIEMTYATRKMALPALENFVTTQLANRIGDKISADMVATIKNSAAAAYYVKDFLTFPDVAAFFGELKRNTQTFVYMTRNTLFRQVISLVDGTGKPIYQGDPTGRAIGTIFGATIKFEDALKDGEIILGDPTKIIRNVVQPLIIETDKNIKTHMVVTSCYAREESGVIDPEALLTISAELTPSVNIKEATATVKAGETVKLTIGKIAPITAKVVWTSGTTAKATVAQDGTVTGVAEGSSVITATITQGGSTYTDTCTVTVTAAS